MSFNVRIRDMELEDFCGDVIAIIEQADNEIAMVIESEIERKKAMRKGLMNVEALAARALKKLQ